MPGDNGKGTGKSKLECPRCGGQGTSTVLYTRLAADSRSRTRTYACSECDSSYKTREKVESQALVTGVVVRKGGGDSSPVRWEPYRREDIADRLRATLVKVLGQSQRDAVLRTLEQLVEQRLGEISQRVPPPVIRQRKWPRSSVYVTSRQIRAVIEEVLRSAGQHLDDHEDRERHEVAHALWALSTTGRDWRAVDLVNWLHENYKLGRAPRLPVQPATNSVSWHPPPFEVPTRPLTVVKNFRPTRTDSTSVGSVPPVNPSVPVTLDSVASVQQLDGSFATTRRSPVYMRRPTEEFDEKKLRTKIREVLAGRQRADQIADGLMHWVMWSLVGQRVVRSSQISALVVDGLRRTDPIGYLRWIAVGKELTVEQLHQEALDVIRYPGTRLVFRADAAPSVRPVILAGDAMQALMDSSDD